MYKKSLWLGLAKMYIWKFLTRNSLGKMALDRAQESTIRLLRTSFIFNNYLVTPNPYLKSLSHNTVRQTEPCSTINVKVDKWRLYMQLCIIKCRLLNFHSLWAYHFSKTCFSGISKIKVSQTCCIRPTIMACAEAVICPENGDTIKICVPSHVADAVTNLLTKYCREKETAVRNPLLN